MKRKLALLQALMLIVGLLASCGSSGQPKGYYACVSVRDTHTGHSFRPEGGYLFTEDGALYYVESSGDVLGPYPYEIDRGTIYIEQNLYTYTGTFKNGTITILDGDLEIVFESSNDIPIRR